MKDTGIVESIKTAVVERTVSPLFGSFVLSWSLWNYRFFMAVFSDLKFKEKLDYIDQVLFRTPEDCYGRGFFYPLVTTALIIYAYPWPAKKTFEFWRKRQRELRMLRQSIDDETPLTVEESRELRKQMAEQRLEHDRSLKQKDDEIGALQVTIRKGYPTEARATTKPRPFPDLNDDCVEILRLLAEKNGVKGEFELFEQSKKPKVILQHHLDVLKQQNLIRHTMDRMGRNPSFELTEVGRRAAVELKLLE